MDYIMLTFIMWITVICSQSGANADCVDDLVKGGAFDQCYAQLGMWAAKAFDGGENGGSPPDMRALLCAQEAKSQIGCFFKLMWMCPESLESMGLHYSALFIPGVDLATLMGDNALQTRWCNLTPVVDPCGIWQYCFSDLSLSKLKPEYGVPAQTYAMVPNHYKKFLYTIYNLCGKLKSQFDCAITKSEGGCLVQPFETKASKIMELKLSVMTFADTRVFMKDGCPAVTDDFKRCVGTTLAKNEFKRCYKNATDTYSTPKTRNSCEMYFANKDCLVKTVQSDCGKPAAMWLTQQSPNIVDSGLPTDCEETSGSTIITTSESTKLETSGSTIVETSESTMLGTSGSTIFTTSESTKLGTSGSKIVGTSEITMLGTSGSLIWKASGGVTLMVVVISCSSIL